MRVSISGTFVVGLGLFALISLASRNTVIDGEMFKGSLHMQNALHAERFVAEKLRHYITAERTRIKALEEYELSSVSIISLYYIDFRMSLWFSMT